jgi:hypothetical protein
MTSMYDRCTPCGEPTFRHFLGRRKITCAQLARIDQALKASSPQPEQALRALDVTHRGGDAGGGVA